MSMTLSVFAHGDFSSHQLRLDTFYGSSAARRRQFRVKESHSSTTRREWPSSAVEKRYQFHRVKLVDIDFGL